MIILDGSYGEGGGALVRTALALSTLTGKLFKVTNIRAGRKKPGLKAQHLTAIKALKEICGARTNEISLGSTELEYSPGIVKRGMYEMDIGTAGSITLLLQAVLLPCLFAPGKVTLIVKGGTCGKWQASVDYLQHLLLPQLEKFVEKIDLKILRRGYYPKGGGEIRLEISPQHKLKSFEGLGEFLEELQFKVPKIQLIEQGQLEQVKGVLNISEELAEREIEERIKRATETRLARLDVPIDIRIDVARSLSVGGELLLWGVFSNLGEVSKSNPVLLGSDVLVEKGKSSEEVGKEAAGKLVDLVKSGAAVDHWLGDQLIQFMGLLPGSEIKTDNVSDHAKTNMYVVEKFLDVGFKVENGKVSMKA